MRAQVANRQRAVRLRPAVLRRAALAAMRAEGCDPRSEVSIVVVSDREIRTLNRRYLKKDRATDVLAFPQGPREMLGHTGPRGLLGDVVISADRAAAQAPRYGQSVEGELNLLVVHGVLHLLGYDDTTRRTAARMDRRQREILALLSGERRGPSRRR